eukprot:467265_1
MAFHFAADTGCVLEISPKYLGILNSTKFIQLSNILEDYDCDTRLFFGRRCTIQINNIWLSKRNELQQYILPLLYLEKLMLQTIFDRQFFNAKHLYDDSNRYQIQERLLNMILSYTAMTLFQQKNQNNSIVLDGETQMMIIARYFPLVSLQEREQIRYVVDLLKHWCLQRTFITFESFPAEVSFMIKSLKNYFLIRNNKDATYSIHIANLQFIMPNLKNYRTFNKHVVTVQPLETARHEVKPHSNSIIDTIDSNLADYYRSQSHKSYDSKFGEWCDRHGYDDQYITKQLQRFEDCNKTVLGFDNEFFHGYQHEDKRLYEILQMATKPHLLEILYADCKDLHPRLSLPYVDFDWEMDDTKYDHSDRQKHSRSNLFGRTDNYYEFDAIYRVLSNCQRHEIPDQICDILQKKLGFWKQKTNTNVRKTTLYPNEQIKQRIAAWKIENKHKLEAFYVPISKLHKASKQDFIKVAKQTKLFDDNMIQRLSNELMERLFADIEQMKPWKCESCWFMNRKMMVGGLWRLYNRLNECGMCGAQPLHRIEMKQCSSFDNLESVNVTYTSHPLENSPRLPPELMTEWKQIEKTPHGLCAIEHDQTMYLEEFTLNEITAFITKAFPHPKLSEYKNTLVRYFNKHDLNAKAYLNAKTKEIIKGVIDLSGNSELKSGTVNRFCRTLTKHVKETTIDCKPMMRIAVILKHYHSMTERLHTSKDRYPCSIRQFVSGYDDKILENFEHILRHRPSIRAKQPYIARCNKGTSCVHSNRMNQYQQMKLSQRQQQKLFNCDTSRDYEYILYLDKLHCALCHDEDAQELQLNSKQKDIIRRYCTFSVYSTGVYIDHSSLSPLHVNLREELINSIDPMTQQNWEEALQHAKDILTDKWNEDDKKWRAKETNQIYGIRINDRIQIEHILVMYLYCSNSTRCYRFRESYRTNEYDDNNHRIRSYHINNFYWMGRFMFASIQFFGVEPKRNDRFYHGLKKQFLFTQFSTIFEPPTSTTTDPNLARTRFAGDNGVVLTLMPKFKNHLNNSKYLDVSTISAYGKEKERLFAGMTVLAIVNIEYKRGAEMTHMRTYLSVLLYFERIMEQTIHNKGYYNYGVVSKKKQKQYLLPMIEHQMQRNRCVDPCDEEDEKIENSDKKSNQYLCALFEHFCDSKQEYINLTCLNEEIEQMDECLQRILFRVNKENVKWEINDANLQLIFPNIKGYKNYLRYWVHFDM